MRPWRAAPACCASLLLHQPPQPLAQPRIQFRRSTNRASAASPNSASTPRTAISAVSAATGAYTNRRPDRDRAKIPLPASRDITVITVVYASAASRPALSSAATSRTGSGRPARHSTAITSASSGPSVDPAPPCPATWPPGTHSKNHQVDYDHVVLQ